MPNVSSISPRTAEPDRLTLLPHCQRGKENGYDAILPEWHSELWMARDLENEVAVSALIKHLPLGSGRSGRPQSTNGLELKHKF